MNAIEQNKLIAEFMGFTYVSNEVMDSNGFCSRPPLSGMEFLSRQTRICVDELLFHTSWDWLMIVVEKIEGLGYWVELMASAKVYFMDIREDETNLPYNRALNNNSISNRDKTTRIDTTYKAIVQFIQWYNKNRKP